MIIPYKVINRIFNIATSQGECHSTILVGSLIIYRASHVVKNLKLPNELVQILQLLYVVSAEENILLIYKTND